MNNEFQAALDNLLNKVSLSEKVDEENFFDGIKKELGELCKQIAKAVKAENAAIFFVTEENMEKEPPFMVMRGASGQFDKILKKVNYSQWKTNLHKEGETTPPDGGSFNGFAYPSKIKNIKDSREKKEQLKLSVTNRIWHEAKGFIANSNKAMDLVRMDPVPKAYLPGMGDNVVYPGKNLIKTFRTMVGIPIFAQGADDQTLKEIKSENGNKYPVSASEDGEFLSKYRVIGILKLEGKKPEDESINRQNIEKYITEIKPTLISESSIEEYEKYITEIKPFLTSELSIEEYGKCKNSPSASKIRASLVKSLLKAKFPIRTSNENKKKIADCFTEVFNAEFTRQDIELLVLLAMQIGRLILHKTMKYAADKKIILSETEIGLLNIKPNDIDQLVILMKGAEAAMEKVKFHLEDLEAELNYRKRQENFKSRVSELLDTHGPIREIYARRKDYLSLINKLLRKQQRLEENSKNTEASIEKLGFKIKGFSNKIGDRFVLKGTTKFLKTKENKEDKFIVTMNLGIEGSPKITIRDEGTKSTMNSSKQYTASEGKGANDSLVYRILSQDFYDIDDLAGIRIITNYDEDIDAIVDKLRLCVKNWNMGIGKIDDYREGREGGYRAVHVTLTVALKSLLSKEEFKVLEAACTVSHKEGKTEEILNKFKIEIQIRTSYQHSWALKTHGTSYKREGKIAQELIDQQEILSNVLAQADWLSGIVRYGISSLLLPPDYGEWRLLEYLKRHIANEDFILVKFGLDCSKAILINQLRYNGQPEFSFAVEVCERLVYSFGVLDSRMLLLALLRNIWRLENDHKTILRKSETDPNNVSEIRKKFISLLNLTCKLIMYDYKEYLNEKIFESEYFPDWFWIMQKSYMEYYQVKKDNKRSPWIARLNNIYQDLQSNHNENTSETIEEWLERAYIMESAVLQASLLELPFEPGKSRKKSLHDDYLVLFREIRKYFPNSTSKVSVVEELDRAFREIETQLDLPRESEWWGE